MTPDGVDYDGLGRLVESQIAGGVSGLVAVGTTGECPTLDAKEHIDVIKYVIKAAAGRVPVFAGTGSNCTREAVELTEESDKAGADGFLVVAPYYNKPSQEGVFLHMSELAKRTSKPIMLYSIPGRCGIEISNDTALRLRDKYDNFCVLKEAGGKVEKVADLRSRADGKIDILRINAKMHGFFKALFIEPNPVPAKTAMKMAGLIKDDFVRLPLCHMRAENVEILKREMINAGIL